MRSGSIIFRNSSVASSAFFSRRICVIRMFALTANTNPGRVASTQFASVEAEGRRRNV